MFYSSLVYKPAAAWLCSLQCLVMDTLELMLATFAVVVEIIRIRLSLSLKFGVYCCLQRLNSVIISYYHIIRTFDLVS